jgi:UDPglucose--hexose-1-phosphate uridylyltransferase
MNKWQGKWEKRWHPLREEWVVYAAHRNQRPWTGEQVKQREEQIPPYDASCYLCPGNPRIHGYRNPDYRGVYVFDNDHPVVGQEAPDVIEEESPLYRRAPARGIARVICYDPRHHLTLADLPVEKLQDLLRLMREQMLEMKDRADIRNVLVFENRGKITGVSNPHPHCQLYAVDFVFNYVGQHLRVAQQYRQQHGRNIFEDIIQAEINNGERIIAQNRHAVAFIPFFARYAYEVMLFPRKRHATLASLDDTELRDLAAIYRTVVRKFDLNYRMPFPYVMSMLQAPVDAYDYPEHHMYLWFQPPLRQPGLQKFLAGPEIGIGNFMADTIPEEKAAELREIDETAYQARV